MIALTASLPSRNRDLAVNLMAETERARQEATQRLDPAQRAMRGQYFTPRPVAELIAAQLAGVTGTVRLLDAGAGVGTLAAAAVVALCEQPTPPEAIYITAYEIDPILLPYLQTTLSACAQLCEANGVGFQHEIRLADFVAEGVGHVPGGLFAPSAPPYTAAVLNPPYGKLRADAAARKHLSHLGLDVSNLYTAFLALAAALLQPGGHLVAITPRSFCNGRYFRAFRRQFLAAMRLRHLHLFETRDQAFRDDAVLQETLIIHAVKMPTAASPVEITLSADADTDLLTTRLVSYEQVVYPDDPETFIRIVADAVGDKVSTQLAAFPCTLADIGLTVSTGRVVDFRARTYLRAQPDPSTVPLLYPANLSESRVCWPHPTTRKPQALLATPATDALLIPNAPYVLVKRFSAKEERKRLVAAVYTPDCAPGAMLGIENHLNYIHAGGRGLDLMLARGLAAYLNWTLVDSYFRQFNGHTQVNATDLRTLPCPTQAQLQALGALLPDNISDQATLDRLIARELLPMTLSSGPDPLAIQHRLDEALAILKALGLPKAQQNERSALTLLALCDLPPDTPWAQARDPLIGITPMMEFFARHYGKTYKPNTRETVRRQTVHQFREAGLILENPDQIRPPNSPAFVYQIAPAALALVRTWGTPAWEEALRAYLAEAEPLSQRYAQERQRTRIPVEVAPGTTIQLSPGGQNTLVAKILAEFAPQFTPGGRVVYVGDTDKKFAYFDAAYLANLGVTLEEHGKIPDVIIHYTAENWLVLIEAVTSHGPVDAKRKDELHRLFGGAQAGLVLVTAFLDYKTVLRHLKHISWETEVWVAEFPTHMIHFNGERFLGPY